MLWTEYCWCFNLYETWLRLIKLDYHYLWNMFVLINMYVRVGHTKYNQHGISKNNVYDKYTWYVTEGIPQYRCGNMYQSF